MYIQQLSSLTVCPEDQPLPADALRGLKRWILVALGVIFVGIGFVGVFLPGIPTTGPLIAASLLLAKSNPRLGRKLLANRIFRNYEQYLDSSRAIPVRARLCGLAGMWISIAASCFLMSRTGQSAATAIGLTVAMGLIGSPVILLYRLSNKKPLTSRHISEVSPVDIVGMQLMSDIPALERLIGPQTMRTSIAEHSSGKNRLAASSTVRK